MTKVIMQEGTCNLLKADVGKRLTDGNVYVRTVLVAEEAESRWAEIAESDIPAQTSEEGSE